MFAAVVAKLGRGWLLWLWWQIRQAGSPRGEASQRLIPGFKAGFQGRGCLPGPVAIGIDCLPNLWARLRASAGEHAKIAL